jgi:hypothetical protein
MTTIYNQQTLCSDDYQKIAESLYNTWIKGSTGSRKKWISVVCFDPFKNMDIFRIKFNEGLDSWWGDNIYLTNEQLTKFIMIANRTMPQVSFPNLTNVLDHNCWSVVLNHINKFNWD